MLIGLKTLIRKIDNTGTIKQLPGSGCPVAFPLD